MTTHTVDISQLAGLNCTDLTITSNSRTADTAELSFRSDTISGNAPWAFGDRVVLTDGEGVAFAGYVTSDPEYATAANQRGFSMRLENIVGLLDATPYTGKQSFDGVVTNEVRLVAATSVISQVLNTGMVAPGGGPAPETYSMSLGSVIQCPVGSGSQSCWSLVNSCLHWIPDAVTWFNPETGTLSLRRADDGVGITLDLANGRATRGDVELFTFAGYTSANFKARRDLQPPVVTLSWPTYGKKQVFPPDGIANQPWAFQFEVPGRSGSDEDVPSVPRQRMMQRTTAQKMIVRGHKVPDGWLNNGNMKVATGAPEVHRKFWSHFPGMRALAKTNAACLRFGAAIFEAVPLEDAYPVSEEDEDNEDAPGQPENYTEFVASGITDTSIYAHYDGSFPASSEGRDNVSGLKFCRGVLKQYVWLGSDYAGELTEEKWKEFFSGSATFTDGDEKKKTRYALLTLECNFINRRRKVYKVGTNEVVPGDPDYMEVPEDEQSKPSSGATDADYIAAASDYFDATRKLFYDGSIALHGVRGYLPAKIDSSNLNIVGGRSEWASMNTPIVRAEWNPAQRTLELSTGSPEILTIDERVQRQQIGRQSSMGTGTSFVYPPSIVQLPDDSGETEPQSYPMISPSINATVSVTKAGKPLNPFELYEDEDGKTYLNEGTLVAPGGKIIDFPVTDISEDVVKYPNAKFSVRCEYDYAQREWVAKIRRFGK